LERNIFGTLTARLNEFRKCTKFIIETSLTVGLRRKKVRNISMCGSKDIFENWFKIVHSELWPGECNLMLDEHFLIFAIRINSKCSRRPHSFLLQIKREAARPI